MNTKNIKKRIGNQVKFTYCEKATKFEKKILRLVWTLINNVKTKWEIILNFYDLFRISELYSNEIFD